MVYNNNHVIYTLLTNPVNRPTNFNIFYYIDKVLTSYTLPSILVCILSKNLIATKNKGFLTLNLEG